MKEIIISDKLTEDNYRILVCNMKLIREFGMYLVYDQKEQSYNFVNNKKPLMSSQLIVLDGQIKTTSLKVNDIFQTFKQTFKEKEKNEYKSYYQKGNVRKKLRTFHPTENLGV